MNTIQKLGLGALVGAVVGIWTAGAYTIETKFGNSHYYPIDEKSTCVIENLLSPAIVEREVLSTRAVDIDGDGSYDEAFVTPVTTKTFSGDIRSHIRFDNKITLDATTHYVAPGLAPEKQLLTGFPKTETMTDDYRLALQMVCNGE